MPEESHSGIHPERDPEQVTGSDLPPQAPAGAFSGRRLRLCYISNPNIVHTRRWAGWFARRGHTVCLLADVPPKEPWSEVPVIDLSAIFRGPVVRFAVWEVWLRRFMRRWRPDILHAHRVNSAGWLGAFSGFHPFVVTPWGSDVFLGPSRSKVARYLARYTLQHADQVTALSHAIGERSVELGAGKGKLVEISLGVDLDTFSPGAAKNRLIPGLSIPDDARVVFSPRAAHPIYNLDIILTALQQVRQNFPEVYFLFNKYNPDPVYVDELNRLAKDLDVGSSIIWLPPTSSPAEMAERYRLSDVVISVPSSDGGTPLTILEAMACAKPVVCSDLPPLHEFITSGENGWLVPVRQPGPLADAILRVLQDPIQAAAFGRKARQVVADRVSLEAEMQRMEAIYYQLDAVRRG